MTAEDLIGLVFVLTMVFGMPLALHRFTVKFQPENAERSRWTMTFAAIGLAILIGFPTTVYFVECSIYGHDAVVAEMNRKKGEPRDVEYAYSEMPERFRDPCPVCQRFAGRAGFCHPKARLDLSQSTMESPIFINFKNPRPFLFKKAVR
jgi:hypothetical protein